MTRTTNSPIKGKWVFGAVLSEPGEPLEVANSYSAWHHEPFLTAEDAQAAFPGRTIMRQWVPYPEDWEPLSEADGQGS